MRWCTSRQCGHGRREVVADLRAELGAALGVSRQTVNSIETGKWLPSLPLAMALARFFGCGVEEVFHVDEG